VPLNSAWGFTGKGFQRGRILYHSGSLVNNVYVDITIGSAFKGPFRKRTVAGKEALAPFLRFIKVTMYPPSSETVAPI